MTETQPKNRQPSNRDGKFGIEGVTAQLRRHVLAKDPDSFLGTEDDLLGLLGASRGTLRQIARILEREGLIAVRRGVNGGYYGTRPSLDSIESAVSGYLHTLDVTSSDATMIASTLWVQALHKLAAMPDRAKIVIMDKFISRLANMDVTASIHEIIEYELDLRDAIFDIVNNKYIAMIFRINMSFASDGFEGRMEADSSVHEKFARDWRNAKYLELAAVVNGDREIAADAAKRARRLWHERFGLNDDLVI